MGGKRLDLSLREAAVLEPLLRHAGRAAAKEPLLEHLCTFDEDVPPNAIEAHVHRLRKKLEPAHVVPTGKPCVPIRCRSASSCRDSSTTRCAARRRAEP